MNGFKNQSEETVSEVSWKSNVEVVTYVKNAIRNQNGFNNRLTSERIAPKRRELASSVASHGLARLA